MQRPENGGRKAELSPLSPEELSTSFSEQQPQKVLCPWRGGAASPHFQEPELEPRRPVNGGLRSEAEERVWKEGR